VRLCTKGREREFASNGGENLRFGSIRPARHTIKVVNGLLQIDTAVPRKEHHLTDVLDFKLEGR
jgi:hypothetical protein